MESNSLPTQPAERPQTRATIVIDREVHRLVKMAAAQEGVGITEYVNTVLTKHARATLDETTW